MTSIRRAYVDLDGVTLVLEFMGGQVGSVLEHVLATEYELEVDDTTAPATVAIWELRPTVPPEPVGLPPGLDYVILDEGFGRELRHRLIRAKPHRVVDRSDGLILPVLHRTPRLSLAVLPAGWTAQNNVPLGEPPGPPRPDDGMDTLNSFTDGEVLVFYSARLVVYVDPESGATGLALTRKHHRTLSRAFDGGEIEPFELPNGKAVFAEQSKHRSAIRFVEGSYLYEVTADPGVPRSAVIGLANALQ